jgi:NAD(P)-dependent dehydrogenase (short-subunit alcohol dehydrogenase family)
MPTVLITGASRGLGLGFARQYAAEALGAVEGSVEVHALDVTDEAAVEALARSLKRDAVDLLLNNAGIYGPRPAVLGGIDYGAWAEVFRVNAMAPLTVSSAFLDHVARSQRRLIVAVTSIMGSVGGNDTGGAYIYRSSKAAANAVVRSLSVDVAGRGITVVPLHPGWVRTDMGGPSAQVDPTDSVTGMRRVIAGPGADDQGRFFDYQGEELPW